jgi:hypothetical protein
LRFIYTVFDQDNVDEDPTPTTEEETNIIKNPKLEESVGKHQ